MSRHFVAVRNISYYAICAKIQKGDKQTWITSPKMEVRERGDYFIELETTFVGIPHTTR